MTPKTIRVTTTVRYRGLPVTLVGTETAGLLAIAGYRTPDELAIAAIAVKRCGGRRVYCVAGDTRWRVSANAVARAAVRVREAP